MIYNIRVLFYCYVCAYGKRNGKRNVKVAKNFVHNKPAVVLGIESSCDDTGCGIVNSNGIILGESISSQYYTHLNYGGIIPGIAKSLHINNITKTCEDALRAANLKLKDIDAIAATVKPGLPMSLTVGTEFGKYLAKIGQKPFIPIHHMEAHALTARIKQEVEFPYLVLLVSGGHSLLAIVENVNKFYLLGTTIDIAPGEVFDKIARRLKLRNIPEFSRLNGGAAIEAAASKAVNVDQFLFLPTLIKYRNCNFSFGSYMSLCNDYITSEEKKHNIIADMVIPDAYNLCASVQLAIVTHIYQRTQRAMEFINQQSLFPGNKRTLVVSGGVACNNFLAKALIILSTELDYTFVRTPPKLSTDNGIMIAWNGIEKLAANIDVIKDSNEIEKIKIESKAPLGENWIDKVKAANIKCKWTKTKEKLLQTV